jgi:copper chaperone
MARVLLGVRGMNTREAADKVKQTLSSLQGVSRVDTGVDGQAAVEYDPGELTVMDLIRSLRRIGFLAGME